MDPATQPQQKIKGLEIARVLATELLIDFVTVPKVPPPERPDRGEKDAEGVVFQIKTVDPLGGDAGPLELSQPKPTDMEEMLEGIEVGADADPEFLAEAGRVVDRGEIEKGIEIFFTEIRDVREGVGKPLKRKAETIAKTAGVQRFLLQFPDESIRLGLLDGVSEEKNEVEVRTGREFRPPRASDRGDGEGPVETGSHLGSPSGHDLGVDRGTLADQRQSVFEIGLEDAGVVRGDTLLELEGFGAGGHVRERRPSQTNAKTEGIARTRRRTSGVSPQNAPDTE